MLRYGLPLIIFTFLAIGIVVSLQMEPPRAPGPLSDRAVPNFELESPVPGTDGFGTADFGNGKVVVVNVFGSWCPPCELEHPQLMRLAMRGVPIYGIDYKDEDAKVQEFLTRLGNPFTAIGADPEGHTGLKWGIMGVPQTYVISGEGRIVYEWLGPIHPKDLTEIILPAIKKAQNLR